MHVPANQVAAAPPHRSGPYSLHDAPPLVRDLLPVQPMPPTTPAHPTALRVLVVDDDERSGRKLADLLRRDGFTVEVCAGGLSGLQRLAAGPAPDVLVTDLRMPQIDGITVARLAREHHPAMPILIVTAYPDLASRLGSAQPAPQIFIKPLEYASLVGALRELREGA